MPISTVDNTSALIVVDLQQGIVGLPLAHPVPDVIDRTVELLRDFRATGRPVVLVNAAGSPPGRTDTGASPLQLTPEFTLLIEELDAQPQDLLVTKYARSAFSRTGLAETLRQRGITQVVVTGIATSAGVESTARDAHEEGFHVTLPVDAMTDRSVEVHNHSITTVFPRIAETGTTAQVLRSLAVSR